MMATKSRKRIAYHVDVAIELKTPDLDRVREVRKAVQVAMGKRGLFYSENDHSSQLEFAFKRRSDQLVGVHQLLKVISGLAKRGISISFSVNDNSVTPEP